MCDWVITVLQKIDIFTGVCKIISPKVIVNPPVALLKQVEVQREVVPHNCCSENNPQRTTMLSFDAAAVL